MAAVTPIQSGNKKFVVAGMGPGGLVAAIEAHRKGYDVIIFDDREHFTRSQRIRLDKEIVDYLKALAPHSLDDKKVLERINAENDTVKIGFLQKFLEKKLKDLKGVGIQKAPEIRKGSKHKIEGFDISGHHNLLKVTHDGKPETIHFDHFVAADGARHQMADRLNASLEASEPHKKKKILFHPFETQTRQAAHGTVSLRSKTGQPIKLKKRDLTFSDAKKLKVRGGKYAWNEPYPPKTILLSNSDRTEFYLAGEIPQAILDITKGPPPIAAKKTKLQQEELTKWAKLIMELKYGVIEKPSPEELSKNPKLLAQPLELDIQAEAPVPPEGTNTAAEIEKIKEANKIITEENKMKTTAFTVILSYSESPCVELNKGVHFTSIGDASMTPNFHLGHGANDAISEGRSVVENLPATNASGKFNSKKFIEQREMKKFVLQVFMEERENDDKRMYKDRYGAIAAVELINDCFDLYKLAKDIKDNPEIDKITGEYLQFIKPYEKMANLDFNRLEQELDNANDALSEHLNLVSPKLKAFDLEKNKHETYLKTYNDKKARYVKQREMAEVLLKDAADKKDPEAQNIHQEKIASTNEELVFLEKQKDTKENEYQKRVQEKRAIVSTLMQLKKRTKEAQNALNDAEKSVSVPNIDELYTKTLELTSRISAVQALDSKPKPESSEQQNQLLATSKAIIQPVSMALSERSQKAAELNKNLTEKYKTIVRLEKFAKRKMTEQPAPMVFEPPPTPARTGSKVSDKHYAFFKNLQAGYSKKQPETPTAPKLPTVSTTSTVPTTSTLSTTPTTASTPKPAPTILRSLLKSKAQALSLRTLASGPTAASNIPKDIKPEPPVVPPQRK